MLHIFHQAKTLHCYTVCVAETLVCTLDLMHVLFPYHVIFNPRSLHVDTSPSVPTLTSSYVHGISSNSLLHQTVGQILDSTAQRWPDREAVVFLEDGIRKTFAQFQQDVRVWLSGARVFFAFCVSHLSQASWKRNKLSASSNMFHKFLLFSRRSLCLA